MVDIMLLNRLPGLDDLMANRVRYSYLASIHPVVFGSAGPPPSRSFFTVVDHVLCASLRQTMAKKPLNREKICRNCVRLPIEYVQLWRWGLLLRAGLVAGSS